MSKNEQPLRDWRDDASYEQLKRLDRRGFAWEYLRRNPIYRDERKRDGLVDSVVYEGGVRIIRLPIPYVAPIWGLRFRRVSGPSSTCSQNLLG